MIYLWAVAIYLVFLIGISIYRSRSVKTQEDFMVAGRKVSAWFLVGTLVCTWIGSGSLFGGAGRAFREGFSALWMSAGAWVGIAIVFFLAGRVRRIAQYTVPDILELRYHPSARLLGTLAIIIAYLTIASYQFIGGGRLLNILTQGTSFEIEPRLGQAIIAGLVVLYTVLAGMLSIVAIDIINGLMITGSILIAAPLALKAAGGWSHLTTALPAEHFTVFGGPGFAAALGLFFPTFLLLLGESSMYQKFFSARDEQTARRAVIGMIIGVIIIETALDSTAIFGSGVYFNDPAFRTNGSFDYRATETVILQLARFNLPVVAGLLLLAGAVAIIFSTANTFLMVPSTNLARDIYQRFVNPDVNDRSIIIFQRVSIVLLALIAYVVSTFFKSILDMALYAYTMVGAAVTPALLAAFLWRRVTPAGGVASIAAGVVVTFVFGALNSLGVTSWDYDYIIYPAGGASIAALVIVSLLTPASPEAKWRPFWTKEASLMPEPSEV
jgi:SSS family solute:Na+ symporter